MALREVIKLPDPILRRKAHKVADFGKDFQKLVDDMIDTMRDEPGVGLAGPQVNVSQRVIVVEYSVDDSDENAPTKTYVFANPEITKRSEETVMGMEGCLSVPNLIGEVERAQEITVVGLNRHGRKQKLHAKGWLARIFQHEIDHLDGVLFVDRAEKLYQPDEIEEGSAV
jgi:peptide deformylase